MKTLAEKLVKILLDNNLVPKKELDNALLLHKQSKRGLIEILLEKKLISDKQLMEVISSELEIPPIDLSKYKIDSELLKVIPEKIMRHYKIVPVSKIGNRLTIAMADPFNVIALDDLKTITGCQINTVIATEKNIFDSINASYETALKKSAEIETLLTDKTELTIGEEFFDVGRAIEESKTAIIVKLVNALISEGIKKRCSDIHIEPHEDYLSVRYRIDGTLQEALKVPKKNQNAVLARLKIMSRLDITEARLAQDGRFRIKFGNREIDFRVSALPTIFGEKIVLRALDKSNLSVGLEKLGFLPKPLSDFNEAITRPFGMILVTGPTGSGKSTTLYSILNRINDVERNIMTIEDPVEYQVDGITQLQVKPEIGLTFQAGLRSLLRQSPDVLMIGEIRDGETADIAIKAALTGQIVFSTLHTNDAAGAVTRLIDMGIEPFLIASSTTLLAAQRLCRKLCVHCKKPQEYDRETLQKLQINFDKNITFYSAGGCKKCNNTGFFGRIAIAETLLMNDELKDMIIKKVSSDEIKEIAVKKYGMLTLRDNAMQLLKNGVTTLEEMVRVTTEI